MVTLNSVAILLLTAISLFTSTASAALITTFSNCLPQYVIDSPTHLQFHPIAVDARLDLEKLPYLLNLTMYGNVTGTSSSRPQGNNKRAFPMGFRGEDYMFGPRNNIWRRDEMEGFNDALVMEGSTQDPEETQRLIDSALERKDIVYETTGQIEDTNPDWGRNLRTTLRTTVNVVSFQLFDGFAGFCDWADCPMNTTYPPNGNESAVLEDPTFLPSFYVSTKLKESYSFTSIVSTFRIITGDSAATHVGCIVVEITPPLKDSISSTIRWLPLGLLLFVGLATISAAIFNPWNGTKDIFRWSSNYGMDDDMLRLVTPGFGDCLQYIQFVVLTGSLTLAYPGFFQPVLSKGSWSILLFNTTVVAPPVSSLQDNLYVVDGKYGLEKMAQYVGVGDVDDIWPVTMAYIFGAVGAVVVLIQLGFVLRWAFMKIKSIAEEDLRAKNWPFTLGMLAILDGTNRADCMQEISSGCSSTIY